MSVIITGMDMPKECIDCLLHNNSSDYCRGRLEIASIVRGKNDCPLKFIDELIENIKTTDRDYRYNGHNLSIDGGIEIIKEYCEVSE